MSVLYTLPFRSSHFSLKMQAKKKGFISETPYFIGFFAVARAGHDPATL